jgi:enoyl-CoA hydratase/carnithine racemase
MEKEMKYQHILYDIEEKICTLTLNRPEKLNAFNSRQIEEFAHALERADRDDAVNVVVVTGAGRAFCAGHDLEEDAEDDHSSIYSYRRHYIRDMQKFTKPLHIAKPVIASVRKYAIGQGFELATICDITIVTDDTQLGYNELRYGLSAGALYLPWLVNMKQCKELLFTGREITAHEAKEMGLVTKVVPPDQLEAETLKMARLVAALPPDIQQMHKTFVNYVYELMGMQNGINYYSEMVAILTAQPVPEYKKLSADTVKHGLKKALSRAKKRYKDLE